MHTTEPVYRLSRYFDRKNLPKPLANFDNITQKTANAVLREQLKHNTRQHINSTIPISKEL